MPDSRRDGGGINIVTEGDGVAEGVVAKVAIFSLVAGLVVGAVATYAATRFIPSREYVETMAALEDTRAAHAVEIAEAEARIWAADRAAEQWRERARDAVAAWESAAANSDSLRALVAQIPKLSIPAVVLSYMEARETECVACGLAVRKHELTIAALTEGQIARDTALDALRRDLWATEDALSVAQREVDRAAGKIGTWKMVAGGVGLLALGAIVIGG